MKLVNVLGTITVILLVAVAAFVFMAPRLGWRIDAVLSGSMEPHLKVGGVVVTQPAGLFDIKRGDIITYFSPINGKLTSHRVVDFVNGAYTGIRTRGDANEEEDPYTISEAQLVGKVFVHIPYFGYVVDFLKTPLGLILTLCLPGLIVVIIEVTKIGRFKSRRRFDSEYARHRLERKYYF